MGKLTRLLDEENWMFSLWHQLGSFSLFVCPERKPTNTKPEKAFREPNRMKKKFIKVSFMWNYFDAWCTSDLWNDFFSAPWKRNKKKVFHFYFLSSIRIKSMKDMPITNKRLQSSSILSFISCWNVDDISFSSFCIFSSRRIFLVVHLLPFSMDNFLLFSFCFLFHIGELSAKFSIRAANCNKTNS